MDILPRSVLTGPARSAAFVAQNKLDQLRVAQQNAAVEARMNALTEQGKSIFHAQQQQVRAAQIQQGFQGLQNAVGNLSANVHAIGSLSLELETSALLPSFVAAHPAVFTDPVLSLYSAAQQAQIKPQVQEQIEPVVQPKKLAQTSTPTVQNTATAELLQQGDATLRNAERLLGSRTFADLASLILEPPMLVKIENAGYIVSNVLYDLPVLEKIPGLYQSYVQEHFGVFPLSSVPKARNYCDQIREDIINATADTACKQEALLLFKRNLIVWRNKSDLVQPVKDVLIQEIEQVDLDMDRINIKR